MATISSAQLPVSWIVLRIPGKLAAILRNRIGRGTDPQQKRDLLDDPQHGVFPRVIR